jgi:hypothetical protein
MGENLKLARPFLLLLAIVTAGRLALGALGVPYQKGTFLFSLITLTVFSCIYYGIFLRRWRGYRLIQAIGMGFLLGVASQLVVVAATLLSYALGVQTYFNHPTALNVVDTTQAVAFSEALRNRAGGLIGNSIFAGIAGALGWTIGGLLPER